MTHGTDEESVAIAAASLDAILAEAAAATDREVCGLLFGTGDRVAAHEPTANVAADPARTFEVDPARLLAAHKAQRRGGPRLIGHYHSHPSGLAEPSPRDAAAARPGQLWLIVGSGDARLWRAAAAGFVELALRRA